MGRRGQGTVKQRYPARRQETGLHFNGVKLSTTSHSGEPVSRAAFGRWAAKMRSESRYTRIFRALSRDYPSGILLADDERLVKDPPGDLPLAEAPPAFTTLDAEKGPVGLGARHGRYPGTHGGDHSGVGA